MSKLTKHSSFSSLKKSSPKASTVDIAKQSKKLEVFFALLQQQLVKPHKKNA